MGQFDKSFGKKIDPSLLTVTKSPYYQLSNNMEPTKNRFEGYESPYSYGDQKSFLDEIYGQYEDEINQQAGEATADLTQDATQRMLSRGIQGGSVVEDTLSGIGSEVNKNKLNVLGNLKAKKAQSNLGLMDTFNTRDFATTQGAQSVDLQNFINQMQKLGLLSDIKFKQEYLDLQKENQEGFWDDFMEVLKTGGAIAAPIIASDIRVKENISKVGLENGFNIYDFNYIGDPRRFRGVMADEVEMARPDAVTTINGIKHVYYDKIGIKFQEV